MERYRHADVSVVADESELRFGNAELELIFDLASGDWLELRGRHDGRSIVHRGDTLRSVQLTVGGRTTLTHDRTHIWSIVDAVPVGVHARCVGYVPEPIDGAVRLTLHTRDGEWQIDQRYTLAPGETTIRRDLVVRYDGHEPALLRWIELRSPWIALGPTSEVYLEAPGYDFRPHRPIGDLPFGRWPRLRSQQDADCPGWHPGLLAFNHSGARQQLLFWAYSEVEPVIPLVDRGDYGIRLTHQFLAADRFSSGHAIEVGTQYVRLVRGEWSDALHGFQKWYHKVNLISPSDTPDWARRAHIYEVCIGEMPFATAAAPYRMFGSFGELIERLPAIRELGFDCIQVMPHMPYPAYSVIDYYNLDIQYGSAEGVRQLVRRAHDLGMRVILDVVESGVLDQEALPDMPPVLRPHMSAAPARHRYRVEHPEWFCQTEDGRTARTQTWSFDLAHPGFQQFLSEVLQTYVREYDVDGFRMDAITWNFFPNWARGLPYRASASHYGAARLFERVRRDLKVLKPDIMLCTETTGPLFHRSFDLAYNYDELWILGSLTRSFAKHSIVTEGLLGREPLNARELARWLHERRLALPAGAIKVHLIDSHDTYLAGLFGQFWWEICGVEAARALFALCCFIDGAIMNFAGGEQGSEEYYRKLLSLRRRLPSLQGVCDYLAVEVDDDMVLALLWSGGGSYAVPVINFRDRAAEVTLTVSAEKFGLQADRSYRVREVVNERAMFEETVAVGADLRGLKLGLKAFGVALLEITAA